MATYKDVLQEKQRLEKLLIELRSQELANVRAIIADLGFTHEDVFPQKSSISKHRKDGDSSYSVKKFRYIHPLNGKHWDGYTQIATRFWKASDLPKALQAGYKHTPSAIRMMEGEGISYQGGAQLVQAFTEANINKYKDIADQLSKLLLAKNYELFKEKARALPSEDYAQVIKFSNQEVQDFLLDIQD